MWASWLLLLCRTHSVILVTNGHSVIVCDHSLVEGQDCLVCSLQPTHLTQGLVSFQDRNESSPYLVLSQVINMTLQYSLPPDIDCHIVDWSREHRVTARLSVITTHRIWYICRYEVKSKVCFFSTWRILRLTWPKLLTNLTMLANVLWWRIRDTCMAS